MNSIVRATQDELKVLFSNVSAKIGLSPGIVEKDFWVVWTLDYLFARSPWRTQLAFKGGTSLSKAYGLIKRFSEDIDLILDWRLLGYGLREPWETRSNTQQDLFNEAANARSAAFLKDVFVPCVKADLESESGRTLDIGMDAFDPNTVVFRYPCVFGETSILREIRIESGALAAWTPAKTCDIVSYAAEYYPQLFKNPAAHVYTVAPERTFWEKVTILHREAMRTPERGLPPGRYSRHYYDLWCLCQSDVKERAFGDIPLLDAVVAFKRKFYRCNWAHYELATAAARTCAVGTGVRLSAHAEHDFRSASAILRDRRYGSRPRGGNSRERRSRELIWCLINALTCSSARRTYRGHAAKTRGGSYRNPTDAITLGRR